MEKYAGVTNPGKAGYARLTIVFEELTDIGNGADRLKRAITAVGQDRYASICRELNLTSDSLDAIPDRTTLRVLVARLEAEVAGRKAIRGEGNTGMRVVGATGCLKHRESGRTSREPNSPKERQGHREATL